MPARSVLITGGAGFFGDILKTRLLADGNHCVSIDLQKDSTTHPNLECIQGDIRDKTRFAALFERHRFEGVFHCAAILAHDVADKRFLWTSNVDGSRIVAELCAEHGVPKLVFTSSNCLWAEPFNRPVTEEDEPRPREVYGASKWEAEKVLRSFQDRLNIAIIRTPTIIDSGRLGLLAILFEFIADGRRVWVVGEGSNRYQFVYAPDLADACVRAMTSTTNGVFNVGSDDVPTVRDAYQYVIDRAATGARIASLPTWPTLPVMRIAYRLGLSPLGPYQYRMIAESFVFDTSRIRQQLSWSPTLTNGEMLYRAYAYYQRHRRDIEARTDVSAHKRPARMGVIRLLKWIS
jgi:UDP-glucose 4-epimerase